MVIPDEERGDVITALAEVLHDMCQPLTALHCGLEIGQIRHGNDDATVWKDCLRECVRLSEAVVVMRSLLQQAKANQQGRDG